MKKQKFMKLSAFTSDPELGNSFSAPATHDGEVSVVFRGKDVSIHGWDGSAWTTIYTWNGLDKQFTFNNTYQNYFLKSLTGYEESVGVSFFSTSRYQGSTPSLAGIDRDVKFHDVDEVPIYTSSDDGKFLTVRSDGSLAWLGLNESYVVEVIGTGEEEQSTSVSYPIVDSIVTDSIFSTYYGASITSEGTLQIGSHGSSMLRTTSTSADNDIEEDTTITMWVKSTETFTGEVSLLKFGQWSSDLPKGIHISFKGRKRFIRTVAGEKASSWTNPVIVVKTNDDVRSMSEWKWFHHFHTPYDIRDGEWHQIVFQFVNVGAGLGNYSAGCKIYVDGQKITESFNELSLIEQDENGLQPLSKNPFDCNANSYITIGKGFKNSEFDGVTIENQILTEEQIVAKYNAGL